MPLDSTSLPKIRRVHKRQREIGVWEKYQYSLYLTYSNSRYFDFSVQSCRFFPGVCEPISAPLFMRGEPTHRSFFAAISCDKNHDLSTSFDGKGEENAEKMNVEFKRSTALFVNVTWRIDCYSFLIPMRKAFVLLFIACEEDDYQSCHLDFSI